MFPSYLGLNNCPSEMVGEFIFPPMPPVSARLPDAGRFHSSVSFLGDYDTFLLMNFRHFKKVVGNFSCHCVKFVNVARIDIFTQGVKLLYPCTSDSFLVLCLFLRVQKFMPLFPPQFYSFFLFFF